MPQSGSPSYLANMARRRKGLLAVREQLLDRPGIPRTGGPPPPTAPAQERVGPQEQALAAEQRVNLPLKIQQERRDAAGAAQEQAPLFDDETRTRLMEQARPFLQEVQKQKMAQLHRRVGRVRRFFGGGI